MTVRFPAPYVATALVFGISGLAFASWAARIPAVARTLDLSTGQMGAALLALAVGSLLALPMAGTISQRIGIVLTIRLGGTVVVLGLIILALSLVTVSLPLTVSGLFLLGAGNGLWDVAQNVEGAAVERTLGRNVMSQFHAAFSGGAFLGALLGAGMSVIGVSLAAHLLVLVVLIVVVVGLGTRHFLPESAHRVEPEVVTSPGPQEKPSGSGATVTAQRTAWREPRTLLIGLVVLGAALTEGSANDWLAKATVDGLGQAEWVGALVYAAFIAAMTSVRLLGGGLLDRWGRVRTLYISLSSALAGLVLFIFASDLLWAIPGVILWGAGAALGFPTGMSAAADDPIRAARRVSVVSTIGYLGFLAGPPLIGLLADQATLRLALLVMAGFILLSLFVVPATRPLNEKAA